MAKGREKPAKDAYKEQLGEVGAEEGWGGTMLCFQEEAGKEQKPRSYGGPAESRLSTSWPRVTVMGG